MMARRAASVCVLSCLAGLASPVASDEAPAGFFVTGAAGLATGATEVARRDDGAAGLFFGVGAGIGGRSVQFVLDGALQAFQVQNPAIDERYRAVWVLPSIQFRYGRAEARAGVGRTLFRFSGRDAFEGTNTGSGVGAAVAWRFAKGQVRWGVEASGRWGSTSDGELRARLLAVGVIATWHPRR